MRLPQTTEKRRKSIFKKFRNFFAKRKRKSEKLEKKRNGLMMKELNRMTEQSE